MSNQKTPPLSFRLMKRFIKFLYRKYTVVGADNLPDGPAIIVGNHAQLHGPLACELYFPGVHDTWCVGEMMNPKEVPAYAYQDFWSDKPGYIRWFFKGVSHLIAPVAGFIFNNANTIPVYHDTRVRTTFRTSVKRMQEGARIIIFPEKKEPDNNILYQFQEHFVDTAWMYYRQTGEAVPFVPMYVAPALKKLYLGKPVMFHPDVPLPDERAAICRALRDEITAMAQNLPRHRVVPYANIKKRDYPYNISEEGASK